MAVVLGTDIVVVVALGAGIVVVVVLGAGMMVVVNLQGPKPGHLTRNILFITFFSSTKKAATELSRY